MKHILLCSLSLMCLLAVFDGRLLAVPSGETVQKNAEAVFSRPEFARLKKLNRSELVRENLSRRFPSGGGGANRPPNGQGNGPNDGQANGQGNGEDGGQGNRQANGQGGQADAQGNGQQNRQGNRQGNGNDLDRNQNPRDAGNPPPQRASSSPSPSTSFGDFGAGMAGLFKMLGMLAIAVMVTVIVVLVVKAFLDRESRLDDELTGTLHNDVGELEADHPPSEYPAGEYLRRAARFANAGDFRQAVALVLLGAMSEVERRGYIRYRKGLTQRDYYRTVRRHDRIGPAYRNILKIYEPLGFGRRTAELQHYQTAVKSFTGGFGDRAALSEV